MKKNNVGIIGCGMIFPRHYQSIEANKNFSLVGVCDINIDKLTAASDRYNIAGHTDFKSMLKHQDINFVVIATPNSQHFAQAAYCMESGCDVLLEKPAVLNPSQLDILQAIAAKNNVSAYSVLQVRLNPAVQKIKTLLDNNLIGKVRGVSLIQRWQRPKEYFDGWRGNPLVGGGTLHECGIHYLDVLCYLFGKPGVVSSKIYNTKHKHVEVEDTVYSLLDYGDFGASVEVSIASEPKNLECSISIMTSLGYIKIGGTALDRLIETKFLDKHLEQGCVNIFENSKEIKKPNSYTKYKGSCPNHPELYSQIENFGLEETRSAISLIDEIYKKSNKQYY